MTFLSVCEYIREEEITTVM